MSAHKLLNAFAQAYLPLRAVVVELQCQREVLLPHFHQPRLLAWLRHLLTDVDMGGLDFDQCFRLDCPENGRTIFSSGQFYRFSLLSTAPGATLLHYLLRQLRQAPSDSAQTSSLAFGPHWQVCGFYDLFHQHPVEDVAELSCVDLSDFQAEASLWASPGSRAFVWHWLASARISLPPEVKKLHRGEWRFCRDSHDTDAKLLLMRCWDTLAQLLRKSSRFTSRRKDPPDCTTTNAHIFWVDHHYSDRKGNKKTFGGQLGQLQFEVQLDQDWLTMLVLAQYLGIGQGTDFGLGRFRLEGAQGAYSLRRAGASETWLEIALHPDNLKQAWRHVRRNRPEAAERAEPLPQAPDEQMMLWQEDEPDNAQELAQFLARRLTFLRERRYQPPPAQACFIPKRDGSLRPLAVPPFWDSVLQRALAVPLAASLESLFQQRSYGYRRGHSRQQAVAAIQSARRRGYRYVFDADIEDFFGSVDHARLFARLLALFDDDPMIDAVMAWVRAPVQWRGQTHPRSRGLPQGSPLSPVLANLMLDDFDNDMRHAGLLLVRFADDFVILCKKPEDAKQAAKVAADSLLEQGFYINQAKTDLQDLDVGMNFLGYLLVGDMALDLSAQSTESAPSCARPMEAAQVQALAQLWLAKLHDQPTRPFTEQALFDGAILPT